MHAEQFCVAGRYRNCLYTVLEMKKFQTLQPVGEGDAIDSLASAESSGRLVPI